MIYLKKKHIDDTFVNAVQMTIYRRLGVNSNPQNILASNLVYEFGLWRKKKL